MSEPRTGSRYELHLARQGAEESKAAQRLLRVHPGDVEEVEDEDDLVGYVHSYEVGSTVDGPGLRFVGFPDRLPAALPVLPQPRHLAQAQRPSGDRLARDAADRQVRARCSRSARAASRSRAASRWCSGRS